METRKGSEATYKALIDALLCIKHRSDAEYLCKLLVTSTTTTTAAITTTTTTCTTITFPLPTATVVSAVPSADPAEQEQ